MNPLAKFHFSALQSMDTYIMSSEEQEKPRESNVHALSDLYRYNRRLSSLSLSNLLLLVSLNFVVSVIQVSSIIDLSMGLKNNDDEFLGYLVIGYH